MVLMTGADIISITIDPRHVHENARHIHVCTFRVTTLHDIVDAL